MLIVVFDLSVKKASLTPMVLILFMFIVPNEVFLIVHEADASKIFLSGG